MVENNITDGTPVTLKFNSEPKDDPMEQDEAFVTEGSNELLQARKHITQFSLKRAKERVGRERNLDKQVRERAEELSLGRLTDTQMKSDPVIQRISEYMDAQGAQHASLQRFTNVSSEIGDIRALSACSIQPCESPKFIATASWAGNCKLWNFTTLTETRVLLGHTERLSDVVFHPQSGSDISPSAVNLATSSADNTVRLWNLESDKPLSSLQGHFAKVNRIAFHPSGRYLASSSFDATWKLWDVETNQELLTQEGHSKPVTTVAFQCDGSLVVSAGTDAIGRIWDLRSGRSVMILKGHVKAILAADFSPNGYHVATGSDDHAVRIWDMRKRKCLHTIPAHGKLISSLRYQPVNGKYLVTSSFDKTTKIWDASTFTPVRTLAGHEDKVMCVDVSRNSSSILTCGYDRTWKLWQDETNPNIPPINLL